MLYYVSPYVRPFWSKRLWKNRPTTSIRQKLRLRPSAKRIPNWCIADMNAIRSYRDMPRRVTYAKRFECEANIVKAKRYTV